MLFIAPGFLAQVMEEASILPTGSLGIKPMRFALRTAKEMIANVGDLDSPYPEIISLAWPSIAGCKEELTAMIDDPMYLGLPAAEFCDYLQTFQNRRVVMMGFSYGGAFIEQVGAHAYKKGYSLDNVRVLSLGHAIGLTGFELFGLQGLYAVGNNDRVAARACDRSQHNGFTLAPSLTHKVQWYSEQKGLYTFLAPIETVLPLPSNTPPGITNIEPKDVFDEFGHHPLGYALAEEGSRTCIDGRYYPSHSHSQVIQRFLGKLLEVDRGLSVCDLFLESVRESDRKPSDLCVVGLKDSFPRGIQL